MSGEPTISIKISELQGNIKNLAKAADSDNSGVIDNAYEHSLFTQYCDAAGEDASDYNAKYSANDTQKAEKELVREQNYSGRTKENMANLEQYESKWQGAMQFAFRAVGNNPESKAKLCEFIKSKPKLQNYTSMADYATALGEKINEMSRLFELDLKEFTTELVQGAVDDINTHTDATVQQAFDDLSQQISDDTAQITKAVRDAQGNITATIRKQTGEIEKIVYNSAGQVVQFVNAKGNQIILDNQGQHSYTRSMVSLEGFYTRAEVIADGEATRTAVAVDGTITRATVRDAEANLSSQVDAATVLSQKTTAISTNLVDGHHLQNTVTRFNKMQTKILESNLSDAEKNQLMDELVSKSRLAVIPERALDELENKIDNAIGN